MGHFLAFDVRIRRRTGIYLLSTSSGPDIDVGPAVPMEYSVPEASERDEIWHKSVCARYQRKLIRYAAFHLFPYSNQAEDVASEALHLIWVQRHTLAADEVVGAWLHSTTRLIAYRTREREALHHKGRMPEGPADAAYVLRDPGEWERLVAPLQPLDRDVLWLHVVEKYTFTEIAEALRNDYPDYKLNDNNLAKRKERALDRLRDHLNGEGPATRGEDA